MLLSHASIHSLHQPVVLYIVRSAILVSLSNPLACVCCVCVWFGVRRQNAPRHTHTRATSNLTMSKFMFWVNRWSFFFFFFFFCSSLFLLHSLLALSFPVCMSFSNIFPSNYSGKWEALPLWLPDSTAYYIYIDILHCLLLWIIHSYSYYYDCTSCTSLANLISRIIQIYWKLQG